MYIQYTQGLCQLDLSTANYGLLILVVLIVLIKALLYLIGNERTTYCIQVIMQYSQELKLLQQ
jgi:sorbitol-specific phosphotransferase system component IIC